MSYGTASYTPRNAGEANVRIHRHVNAWNDTSRSQNVHYAFLDHRKSRTTSNPYGRMSNCPGNEQVSSCDICCTGEDGENGCVFPADGITDGDKTSEGAGRVLFKLREPSIQRNMENDTPLGAECCGGAFCGRDAGAGVSSFVVASCARSSSTSAMSPPCCLCISAATFSTLSRSHFCTS